MENADWLDEGVVDDSWLDEVREPGLPVLIPRHKSARAIPQNEADLEAVLSEAWDKLTTRQQIFLDSLKRHNFNIRETCRALEKTNDKICRNTVTHWNSGNENFAFVVKALKAIARKEIVDPETLILRANDIAEQALAPKPILHQGRATGFFENHLGQALAANEQLMKATGMLKGEKESTRVVVRVVNLAGMDEPEAIETTAEVIDG